MIAFQVPGQPVGKGRARSGCNGNHYTPAKTRSFETLVALAAKQVILGAAPLDREFPVACRITVTFAVPASWSKRKREAALDGTIRPTVKPDISNVLKAAEDAMNRVVFEDDCQICELAMTKRYGPVPGLEVEVWPL